MTAQLGAAAIAHLQDWQCRSENLADDITVAPVAALAATLDRDDPAPAVGTELRPCGIGFISCPVIAKANWAWTVMPSAAASCRLCHSPVACGPVAGCVGNRKSYCAWVSVLIALSSIESVEHKGGRSSELVFVLAANVMIRDVRPAVASLDTEVTRGADKGYDAAEFIEAQHCLKVTPHVAVPRCFMKSFSGADIPLVCAATTGGAAGTRPMARGTRGRDRRGLPHGHCGLLDARSRTMQAISRRGTRCCARTVPRSSRPPATPATHSIDLFDSGRFRESRM